MPNTTWALVDGSSYLFRAFYALPELTAPDGSPTGAIYGVVNMLKKLAIDLPEARVVVVFDPPGPTTRHQWYPDYKANRSAMPDDLRAQISTLHALLLALGWPVCVAPGVEADDVLGTLARQAIDRGDEVVLVTGDKDFAQLVGPGLCCLDTMKGHTLDADGVVVKFGVRPDQLVDYLALVGDSSDNIPGVPGVGPKTASKWLAAHGSLERLLERPEGLRGKAAEALWSDPDRARLAQRLVTIDTEVALPFQPLDEPAPPVDTPALVETFERLGFQRWHRELMAGASEQSAPSEADAARRATYTAITSVDAWQAWYERLQGVKVFALDFETTSLVARHAEVVGVALALDATTAAYVPLTHTGPGADQQVDADVVLRDLATLLADPERCVVAHHWKYDAAVWAGVGRGPVHAQVIDTLLMQYVWRSVDNARDLDTLANTLLGWNTLTFDQVVEAGDGTSFASVPIELATGYAAEDAAATMGLYQHFRPLLEANPPLWRVLAEVDMPLVDVLVAMEQRGVAIDAEELHAQGADLAERLATLEASAYASVDATFNLASPKQLQSVLYDQLGLPVRVTTPKGQPSTSEEALQQLVDAHPLVEHVLAHRHLSKLKNTYLDKLPTMIDPVTGRLHTSFNQAVTATGRLSSNHPNLQNIPIRTAEGRAIRRAFVAPPGRQLLCADYSQIELRIMAHLSEDPQLLRAFHEGLDVHAATASEVFGVPIDAVTSEQRRRAKAVNFGLIYGMSAFGLAKQLRIERGEAAAMMATYFERYPHVEATMARLRETAREQGYVETLLGRRLYLPDLQAKQAQRRMAAERTAINAPMQGTAADLIKCAMVTLHRALLEGGWNAELVLQVHDELVLEVDEADLSAVHACVKQAMEGAMVLRVPLDVVVGVGPHWDAAH